MHRSATNRATIARPAVWLAGDWEHPEFGEALALLRTTADAVDGAAARCPELIVWAQSRPGAASRQELGRLRERYPLAGVVVLAGSWCEGEPRTGRPPAGAHRLYWYEFPAWWREQLARRASGDCPAWAWPAGAERPNAAPRSHEHRGLVVLDTPCWETADALADVLRRAGFATAWFPPRDAPPQVSGAVAGIWDGGQLDDAEVPRLERLCHRLRPAPVVALLDFPRRERCEAARRIGVAAVLGKPWRNADLVATLDGAMESRGEEIARAA